MEGPSRACWQIQVVGAEILEAHTPLGQRARRVEDARRVIEWNINPVIAAAFQARRITGGLSALMAVLSAAVGATAERVLRVRPAHSRRQ